MIVCADYLKYPNDLEKLIELKGYILGQGTEDYIKKGSFLLLLDAHIQLLKDRGSTLSQPVNRQAQVPQIDLGETRAEPA